MKMGTTEIARRRRCASATAAALICVASLLVSCPNPIPLNLAVQVSDGEAPVITVTSPEAGATYQERVTVAGTVVDADGEIAGVVLRVAELGIEDQVDVDSDGAVSHQIDTADLAETLTFELAATDWNGNAATVSFQMTPDTDGPVFTLSSPTDESEYTSTIELRGSVTDNDSVVETVALEVKAADVEETLTVAADGSFAYDLDATGISKTIIISLTATDAKGNAATLERTLFNDGEGPHIVITEPEDFSAYGTVVRVSGAVTDAEVGATTDEVAEARWSIPGTSYDEPLVLADDGAFSFDFVTRDSGGTSLVDGSASLTITATDKNGNVSELIRTIVKATTGDFASFTVTPGNAQATLEWSEVEGASSYTAWEVRFGGSEANVTSPYVWNGAEGEGLQNGELYSFQIRAHVDDDGADDAWSTVTQVMPASGRTFAPWTREISGDAVTLEWVPNDHVEIYQLERAVSPEGPWELHASLTACEYPDGHVQPGTDYWYRVLPRGITAPVSDAAWANATRLGHPILATVHTPGSANNVVVSGDYVYVADGSGDLRVLDISDPEAPVAVGACAIPGTARDVAVAGDHAYVAAHDHGLQVIDISDPAAPVRVGSYDTDAMANGIAVSGSYAYLVDYQSLPPIVDGGLYVFDVTDPSDPQIVGSHLETNPSSADVAVAGDYAYVAALHRGLQVFSVTDPAAPVLSGTYSTGSNYPLTVHVAGDYAYVGDSNTGLDIVDVTTDPGNPSLVGNCPTPESARGVCVSAGYAYVATKEAGLQVIDVSVPASPVITDSRDTPGSAYGVAVDGGYAYVADSASGVQVIDARLPDTPVVTGQCDVGSERPLDVSVSGSYAYVATGRNGLSVVDISVPTAPAEVGACDTGQFVGAVAVAGRCACVAAFDAGMQVIDVADPANPVLLATCDTPGSAEGVALAGRYAYVADDTSGLQIVDLTVPAKPVIAGGCSTAGSANDVAVAGGYAYVADSLGLSVVRITDPANPVLVGSCNTANRAVSVVVAGSYAYVADNEGSETLQVIDISDPEAPVPIGVGDAAGFGGGHGIDVAAGYVFLTDLNITGSPSLSVFSVDDPTAPHLVGTGTPPYGSNGVAIGGEYAFVADNADLVVFRLLPEL